MSNDVPLLVQFDFEQGTLQFFLAPKVGCFSLSDLTLLFTVFLLGVSSSSEWEEKGERRRGVDTSLTE
jgi:hypothetical protein